MSINHLIDNTIPTPRYDIYVNDIDCNEIDITGDLKVALVNASVGVIAPSVTATTELFMASQNNYNDILSNDPFASGLFLFDEGLNGFTNLSDIWQYVKSRKVAGNGIIDTYKLTWSGETQAVTVDAIFDFKSLNGYDEIIDVKGFAQWEDVAGVSDFGIEISGPQDPANDFQVELNTDNTAMTVAGRVILFSLEIQLFRLP